MKTFDGSTFQISFRNFRNPQGRPFLIASNLFMLFFFGSKIKRIKKYCSGFLVSATAAHVDAIKLFKLRTANITISICEINVSSLEQCSPSFCSEYKHLPIIHVLYKIENMRPLSRVICLSCNAFKILVCT